MEFRIPGGSIVPAHIPNPGRLEEFRFPGSFFALIPTPRNRIPWRVTAVLSGSGWVLLDAIAVNAVAAELISRGRIPGLHGWSIARKEVPAERSRLDFLLRRKGDPPLFLEVKSCTLVHRGTAMFPDAPSERARRHLRDLERLAAEGGRAMVLMVCPHPGARRWRPNAHTDPEYCRAVRDLSGVEVHAVRVTLRSPGMIDLANVKSIPVLSDPGECTDSGGYVLEMHAAKAFSVQVGALGRIFFPEGHYLYVGSARRGLSARIGRHHRRRKRFHWHIDYVLHRGMRLEKAWPIRHPGFSEVLLARALSRFAEDEVPGFGAGDSPLHSHLFRFAVPPMSRPQLLEVLLDCRIHGVPGPARPEKCLRG